MTVYRQSAHNFGWNVKELDDGLFVNVNPIHYESWVVKVCEFFFKFGTQVEGSK